MAPTAVRTSKLLHRSYRLVSRPAAKQQADDTFTYARADQTDA
ncbi:MAG: hypothetical protein QOG79_7501 [Mycobacterium sp.]|jgi:hypothetical protein|nr:hypothetical protein [Mycobacterium sp.]MDT5285153.1 hypothetical protein [Mycobacterium sp.]MDT5303972.1 hypothetical protein [Mycobacterium sp.]